MTIETKKKFNEEGRVELLKHAKRLQVIFERMHKKMPRIIEEHCEKAKNKKSRSPSSDAW